MSLVVDMSLLFSEFQFFDLRYFQPFPQAPGCGSSQTSTFPSSGSTRVLNLEFPVIMLSTRRAIIPPKNITMKGTCVQFRLFVQIAKRFHNATPPCQRSVHSSIDAVLKFNDGAILKTGSTAWDLHVDLAMFTLKERFALEECSKPTSAICSQQREAMICAANPSTVNVEFCLANDSISWS